jgi:hypothetical protein
MVTMKANVIPTLDEMKAEFRKRHFYGKLCPGSTRGFRFQYSLSIFQGFVSCVSALPLILMERTSAVEAGMDVVLEGEKRTRLQESMYGGAKYQEAMQYNLKRFDEMHVLD